ncbi:MAG: serine/threonine protein kinase [Cellvibrionaceae bacterium]|jgi:serine/threonine protein kinase
MSDIIGQKINQYRIEKILGEGGMGRVYLAWDDNLDRQVAIKLMHSQFAAQKEFRERLTQEAKTAANLDHPSIVRVYDFGDSEHGPFIAMEYISGGTLRSLLRSVRGNNRFIQIDQVLQIGIHIAEALDYAHSTNVVHRDVKPGNIILKQLPQPEQPSGFPFRAMLTDFGLVKVSESTLKTQTGFTMGTPIYMSPEQCHGSDLDGRSDIYSLGVVLYELATGQPPFAFRSLTEALSTHMKGQMPPVASIKRGEIPPVLDTVLTRMLAKDPDDRFQSGQQVAEFLRNSAGSLENTPTRAFPKISRSIETEDRKIVPPPANHMLLLESGDNEPAKIDLVKSVITIGRSGNNDITLPIDGVSRFNTRLQATSAGWELIDLGGINGTWLNGARVPSQEAILLQAGDRFEIESYAFTLEAPEDAKTASNPAAEINDSQLLSGMLAPEESDINPSVLKIEPEDISNPPSSSSLQPAEESEPEREKLTLLLSKEKYRIKAGQSLTIGLEILNRSQEMARVNVRVMGLPGEWFKIPDEFTDIPPRQSKSIPVKISVPYSQDTPVGPQRMRVRLISPQFPNLDTAASLTLDLAGYSEFKSGMTPEAIVLPAEVKVSIQNQGNLPGRYEIRLGHYDTKLQIGQEMKPIHVPAGETVRVPVPIESSSLRMFGSRVEDRFDLHVVNLDDETQNRVMSGAVTFRPMFPMASAGMLAIVLVVVLLSSCMLFLIRGNNPLQMVTERFGLVPTATVFTFLEPTQEIDVSAVAATSQAENATASALGTIVQTTATPADGLTDTDGDGLSNGQEATLGTSPTEPDSDRDGLKDGDEVLKYGTNPLIQDTDRDVLTDGEEVLQFGTNPLQADSDGDGVSDGAEITAQTNPLIAASTATLAPTAGATATATEILTPAVVDTPVVIVVTATPLPSETPTEIPASTPTEIPSETPTKVPVVTEVPTEISTEVAPDPIATPVVFSLACNSAFTPDGNIDAEWSSSSISVIPSQPNGTHTLNLLMHRDVNNLYIGLQIAGGVVPPDSKLSILFENNSGGDPDAGDLMLSLTKAGVLSAQTGRGNNADGLDWEQLQNGAETIILASNAAEAADWQVELKVPVALANALLSSNFLIGVDADLITENVTFPDAVDFTISDTQATVNNPSCQ